MIYYLGIGSNLGDREKNVRIAVEELGGELDVIQTSSLYETEPWGLKDQPSFLNGVVKVRTGVDPFAMLKLLKRIEGKLGREADRRWGPRVIDIDIVAAFEDDGEEVIIDAPTLKIPHELAEKRDFVLLPLKEVEPTFILKGKSLDHWISKL